jgi:hypothetical protein
MADDDIRIKGPDGVINRFPKGTPDDAMTEAMRTQYGGPGDEPPKPVAAKPAGPELRAYDPTFRNKAAGGLDYIVAKVLGEDPEARPSSTRERLVQALAGGGPLGGSTTVGVADLTPAGIVMGAQEGQRAAKAGHWGEAALGSLSVIPGAKPVAQAAKTAAETVASKLPKATAFDPTPHAERWVSEALRKDAKLAAGDPGTAAAEAASKKIEAGAEAGQDVRLLDVGGEETRTLMRTAANTSPAAREAVKDVTDPRYKEQAVRMVDWLRKATGNPEEAQLTLDKIREAARSPTTAAYNAAYAAGENGIYPGPPTGVGPEWERVLQQAYERWANEYQAGLTTGQWHAGGKDGMPLTLEAHDKIKRVLDDKVGAAKRAGENEAARLWSAQRNKYVEELDKAVPEYAIARGNSAKVMGAGDAVEAGEKIAQSRMLPGEIEKMRKQAGPEEWGHVQSGYVDQVIRTVLYAQDRADVVKRLAASEGARQQLDAVLGPETARKLEAVLEIETLLTRAKEALSNSTTVAQAEARQRYQVPQAGVSKAAQMAANFDPSSIGTMLFGWGKKKVTEIAEATQERQTRQVMDRVVEMLLSKDAATYYRAIDGLASSEPAMKKVREMVANMPDLPTKARQQGLRALSGVGATDDRTREKPRLPGEVSPMGSKAPLPGRMNLGGPKVEDQQEKKAPAGDQEAQNVIRLIRPANANSPTWSVGDWDKLSQADRDALIRKAQQGKK